MLLIVANLLTWLVCKCFELLSATVHGIYTNSTCYGHVTKVTKWSVHLWLTDNGAITTPS